MAVKKDLNQLKTQLANKTPTATALSDTTSSYTAPAPTQPSAAKPTTSTTLPTANAIPQFKGGLNPNGRTPVVSSDYLSYLTDLAARNKSNLSNGVYAPLTQNELTNVEAQAARDAYRAQLNSIYNSPNTADNKEVRTTSSPSTPAMSGARNAPKTMTALGADVRGGKNRPGVMNGGKEYVAPSLKELETYAEAADKYKLDTTPNGTQSRLLAMAAAKYAADQGIKMSSDDITAIVNGDYSSLAQLTLGANNPLSGFGAKISPALTPDNPGALIPDGNSANISGLVDALMNAYYNTNGYPDSAGGVVSPAITYNNDYRVTAPKTQTSKFATDFGDVRGNITPYDPKAAAALAEALSQTTKPDSGKGTDGNDGDKGDNGGSGDNGGTGSGGSSGTGGGAGGYGLPGDIGQYLLNFSDKYYKESQKYLDEVMETMKKEGKNQQNQLEKTLGETLFDLQKQRAANNAAAFTTNANVGALTAGNVQADQASARELSKSADTYYNNLQTLLYQLQSSKNNWSTNRWGWIYDALGDYMYGAMGSQAAAQIGLQQALAEIAASKSLQAEQNKWIESHPEFYSTQS